MNTQSYSTDGIVFSYRKNLRKWQFDAAGFSLAQPCKGGGVAMASKVAKQINGAMKRTGGLGLDQLARVTIKKITGY